MKPEEFYARLADHGFPLTDRQKEQYERYFELLVEWNVKINLTAITEKDESISSIFMILSHPFYKV